MALSLGNLTTTTLFKLESISTTASLIDNLSSTTLSSATDAVSSLTTSFDSVSFTDKAKTKIPANCLKNKSTGKGSSGNPNKNDKLKLNCEPIISKQDIMSAINLNGEFSFLDKTNKGSISDIVDGVYDKLNSATLPAISRSMLLDGLGGGGCSFDLGLNLPSFDFPDLNFDLGLNLPSFDFPDLSFDLGNFSLLSSLGSGLSGIGGLLSVIGGGIGSVLSGIVGCGSDIIKSTLNVFTTADQITDKFANKGMINGFIESGNLDLSVTKQLDSFVPSLTGILDDVVSLSPISNLSISDVIPDIEVNSLLGVVSESNALYDIATNETILAVANKSSKINTIITDTILTPAKKISVLSMVKKSKMKLVA